MYKKTIRALCLLITTVTFAEGAYGVPPPATVTPVEVPGTQAFGRTTLDLASARYVEEEFYISGSAHRYRITDTLGSATVIDNGYPYTSRILVRRPMREKDFNGTVVVEWYNVTIGQDVDFVFAAVHEHLLRKGYAYVAVSAQLVGVNELVKWNPARYGSLNISASNVDPIGGGKIDSRGDVLSWDIYGQVASALQSGEALGGLKPKQIIAMGESQSAARLTAYYNSIQPLHRVYNAFLTYDKAGPLRNDIATKSISIGTEASAFIPGFGTNTPPDSNDHRWWEVAGTSHASLQDVDYLDPIIQRDGVLGGLTFTAFLGTIGCQEHPIWSRVPTGNVLDTALESLIDWATDGVPPPRASRFVVDASGLPVRDAAGRVLGGVRLPGYDAPTAVNSGQNPPPSPPTPLASFCALVGHHYDFSNAELCARYGDHEGYVAAVGEVAHESRADGFLLKSDEKSNIREARKFHFACGKSE